MSGSILSKGVGWVSVLDGRAAELGSLGAIPAPFRFSHFFRQKKLLIFLARFPNVFSCASQRLDCLFLSLSVVIKGFLGPAQNGLAFGFHRFSFVVFIPA
jgi:hypothetical protein